MLAKNISSIAPPRIKVTASSAYPKSFRMNHILQWGDTKMSVQFSTLTSSWTYTCIFGCYEWDFEGQQEATEAFLSHDCACSRIEPSHGGLAWTSDEEIEESQARLRESHPEVWDAWLEWTNPEPCS